MYVCERECVYVHMCVYGDSFLLYLQNPHFLNNCINSYKASGLLPHSSDGYQQPNFSPYSFIAILKAYEVLEVSFGDLGLTQPKVVWTALIGVA